MKLGQKRKGYLSINDELVIIGAVVFKDLGRKVYHFFSFFFEEYIIADGDYKSISHPRGDDRLWVLNYSVTDVVRDGDEVWIIDEEEMKDQVCQDCEGETVYDAFMTVRNQLFEASEEANMEGEKSLVFTVRHTYSCNEMWRYYISNENFKPILK